MGPSKLELAVLNSVHWYEAMFAAHGLAGETDGRVWFSHATAPPFHSNLVVVSPAATQVDVEAHLVELGKRPRPGGWSVKDSYTCLDLSPLGFAQLFQAEWIWRDPAQAAIRDAGSRLSWARVTTADQLAEWERAWSGDVRNGAEIPSRRQFPDRLLQSLDHAFFAGHAGGSVVAGGIANRSPGVVGLSNLFAPQALAEEAWNALVSCAAATFPNAPLVGYERGADLEVARRAGFLPVGALRVWCRPLQTP